MRQYVYRWTQTLMGQMKFHLVRDLFFWLLLITFVDDQWLVHTKSTGGRVKDCGLDKDLLVSNGLVAVALLEDVGSGESLSGEMVLGHLQDTGAGIGLGLNSAQGRDGEDKGQGDQFGHVEIRI